MTEGVNSSMAGNAIHPYHQQWPPAAVVPPPTPPPAAPPALSPDEVRRIFITGLLDDVKERQLQNLLQWLPGFEASQLNFKADKPMGFALFSTPHQAIAAKYILQDMLFDPDSKSVLHTEMAKKNLFIKRGIGADAVAFDQSKRLRTAGDYTQTGYVTPSPYHPPPPLVWGPHG